MYTDVEFSKPGVPDSNTPIYRLPDDILLDIFLLDLKTVFRLIVISGSPLSAIQKSLAKSKGALLDVSYTSHV
ncbi:hypothetical protein FRB94_004700 [Tulasnella sp. JGI-2019a]|nr:hypothetical protein FRB93_011355 [Tulasnella sp. JGI-2019a]KAG9012890.1 hypothetical protein FRB94_004700 [Tulasnella sp. JGI-2019a]KAG9036645.1 hypothetical protein FRB95_008229 [Tulasnella sp. JGI-2019a]